MKKQKYKSPRIYLALNNKRQNSESNFWLNFIPIRDYRTSQ